MLVQYLSLHFQKTDGIFRGNCPKQTQLRSPPWVIKCPHFSHHPTKIGINGLLDGYYFRWCPLYSQKSWDIYQPQWLMIIIPIKNSNGKSPFLMGKSTISMAPKQTQLRSPQKANQLGRGPIVAQPLRLDDFTAQHGVKELPPVATALMALDHVEIQTAQRRDLHQTWEKWEKMKKQLLDFIVTLWWTNILLWKITMQLMGKSTISTGPFSIAKC